MRFSHLLLPAAALAFVTGCSDPVPPTPKGAWSIAWVQLGGMCPIAGHGAMVGDVNDHAMDSVLIDQGAEGASVTCTVSGAGTFAVNAQEEQGTNNLEVNVPAITKDATSTSPAKGVVAYSSAKTAGNLYTSDPMDPCQFYFVPSTNEGVDAGKVWFAFTCPAMKGNMTDVCQIKQGYAVFENCSTE